MQRTQVLLVETGHGPSYDANALNHEARRILLESTTMWHLGSTSMFHRIRSCLVLVNKSEL